MRQRFFRKRGVNGPDNKGALLDGEGQAQPNPIAIHNRRAKRTDAVKFTAFGKHQQHADGKGHMRDRQQPRQVITQPPPASAGPQRSHHRQRQEQRAGGGNQCGHQGGDQRLRQLRIRRQRTPIVQRENRR